MQPKGSEAIQLHFEGPYAWHGTNGTLDVSQGELSRQSGIYLWTVQLVEGELIYYVGQTGRSFASRMLEHFAEHASGGYELCDPELFRQGKREVIWPGRYGPARELSVRKFLGEYERLAPVIQELSFVYRFFLAPIDCERRLRDRIEAAISGHLFRQKGPVGDFQDPPVRYNPRRVGEDPIKIYVSSSQKLLGLPSELFV